MEDPAAQRTIPRVVAAAAESFGAASAVEDGAIRWSFRDLAAEALRANRAFLAAGIEPGDRVAVWAPNIAEWIVAAIGLSGAGAVMVPMSTRFKGAEAGFSLRKSRARILCTVSGFIDTDYVGSLANEPLPDLERTVMLRGAAAGGESWDDFLEAGEAVSAAEARERAEAVAPDDYSDMMFTSGTTGDPKGVLTTHAQTVEVFQTWSDGVGLRAGDRYLVVMPFFHTFGYKAGWLAAIMRGATVLPQLVFEAGPVLERIAADRVTVFPGAPALYQSLLAHPGYRDYDLSSLRLAVTGAAPTPVELVQRMRTDLGFDDVLTAYGLTESCGTVSMCRPGDDDETVATTSGRAIPGVEVRCVDSEGKEVPRGEQGEVLVRGYNVMRGYFEDPEETAKAVDSDGWLHTGDVAVMDERGYLRITDRVKDMFIMGGFNCYPAEIEKLMFRHEEIAHVAVIGVPDERMGEVGVAFVVPMPGTSPAPEAIIAWCREQMSNYKVPRRVELIDELPLNASGKVMKFQLRERAVGAS